VKTQEKSILSIYVVSGGSGLTGHTVINALLAQYPDNNINVELMPNVRDTDRVKEIVSSAKAENALIAHTLVCADIRLALIDECLKQGIIQIDYMGPLAQIIEKDLGLVSISEPGLYRKSNSQYFERIDAIEFTLNADDGLNPEKLFNADIILTGVSRAGKTPLSIYMSMLGWKVANVPLVLGIDPPQQLFQVDPQRVFGLKISQVQLTAHRMKRLININNESNLNYVDKRMINDEIRYANRIFEKGGFTEIVVTNKPIENSSNEIIEIISKRFDYSDQKQNNN